MSSFQRVGFRIPTVFLAVHQCKTVLQLRLSQKLYGLQYGQLVILWCRFQGKSAWKRAGGKGPGKVKFAWRHYWRAAYQKLFDFFCDDNLVDILFELTGNGRGQNLKCRSELRRENIFLKFKIDKYSRHLNNEPLCSSNYLLQWGSEKRTSE